MTITVRAAVLGSVLAVLPFSMVAGQEQTNAQQDSQPTAVASMVAAAMADPTVDAISICVVPGSGTVYRVGVTGAPARCLQASHQLLKLNLAGARGEMGPMGPAGDAGLAGLAGATGSAGVAGVAGEVGPMGPAGPIGPAGVIGATGPAGLVGPIGPPGAIGAAGLPGLPGLPGLVGPVGPAGVAGVAGPAGPAGENGTDGEQGPAGPAGATGQVGPQGPQGIQGADGAAGPTGATGAKGDAGGISGYERLSSSAVTVNMGQVATVSQSCTAGKKVIAGGFTLSSTYERHVMATALSSYPSADDTWTVRFNNSDWGMGMTFSVSAYAICVSGSPPPS